MSGFVVGLSLGLIIGCLSTVAATLIDGYIAARVAHKIAPGRFEPPPPWSKP